MSLKKFRWSRVYESSEEELVSLLEARNLEFERVYLDSGAQQTVTSGGATTIWCAEGSLAVNAGPASVSLQSGDALRLEAGTTYSVHPGIADCAYYLTS